MAKREVAQSVRIVRLEVSKVSGEWKDTTNRWHEQQRICQQIANTIWQTWLVWHVENGSADQLRAWLEKRKSDGVKAAGKCPIQAVPNVLAKKIYDTCRKQFGTLHTRSHVLLQQRIVMGIGSRKASSGSLPGWSAILLAHESLPSFTKGIPIPFDSRNAVLGFADDGTPTVELKTTLLKKGKAVCDTLMLWSKGRRVLSQVQVFKKIQSGEFKFCGSSLQYNRQQRKWFVMLSYQRPVHRAKDIDKSRTAYLIPGRKWLASDRNGFGDAPVETSKVDGVPFLFRVPGETRRFWPQRKGAHIESMRRRVCDARRGRSANYRLATARKGRGRSHANKWRDVFSRMWSEFVRRCNHQTSHDVVTECVNRGIGRLVYLKPSGIIAEHRAVSRLGATGQDQTTWEFFQLKTMLEYKCQDLGIEFLCVECDGTSVLGKSSVAAGEAA